MDQLGQSEGGIAQHVMRGPPLPSFLPIRLVIVTVRAPLLSRYHPVYDENGFKCQPPTGKGIEANDDDEVPSLVPEESVQIQCEGSAVSALFKPGRN